MRTYFTDQQLLNVFQDLDRPSVLVHQSVMPAEPLFTLMDPELARRRADQLFIIMRGMLSQVLPPNADIRHIGATAVPGCLTKGDLDIVVRVPAEDFAAADAVLASKVRRNEGSVRSASFSAFEDSSNDPHIGLQLTAIDGPYDFFHWFHEALLRSPWLVIEYNDLKRHHDGEEMKLYRAAKDAFIEKVLRDFRPGSR